MKLLRLDLSGLTPDRLATAVTEVVQSIIFYRAGVAVVLFREGVSFGQLVSSPYHMYVFYDQCGKAISNLPLEVWKRWIGQDVPLRVGEHHIAIPPPPGTHNLLGNWRLPGRLLDVMLKVDAFVLTVPGRAQRQRLINAFDGAVEREHISAEFTQQPGEQVLRIMETQEALDEYLDSTPSPRVTGHVRLPRIVFGAAYWPLSDRTLRVLSERAERMASGEQVDLPSLEFYELEGPDLVRAWEGLLLPDHNHDQSA